MWAWRASRRWQGVVAVVTVCSDCVCVCVGGAVVTGG